MQSIRAFVRLEQKKKRMPMRKKALVFIIKAIIFEKERDLLNYRTYLALAIPLTISTMTTPLLGAVDTAVVGRLSDPAYIGGVAVGALIFNTLYWLFGFLRVSTSAFAAQANGANSSEQGILALSRPFLIALAVGLIFILLQIPIQRAALQLCLQMQP